MKTSDFVSSSKVTVNGQNAGKTGHLKLVNKGSKDDSDASDAFSGLAGNVPDAKAKVTKAKAHTDSKADSKGSSTTAIQGQFSALLDQVEKKLSAGKGPADDDDQSVKNKKAEDSDDTETGTDALKSQNGTTSLFAGAFMMRDWEPALITQADAPSTVGSDERPAAANGNKIQADPKATEKQGQADAKQVKDESSLKVVDTSPQPKAVYRNSVAEKSSSANPDSKNVGRGSPVETIAQVQVTTDLDAEEQIQTREQSLNSVTPSGSSVKTDTRTLADAQAQGVVSAIHVTQARDASNNANRGDDSGKDGSQKDHFSTIAKTEIAEQASVKPDASAAASAAAALQQADAPSPVSQVVERILQELPAQSATVNADQVAQASKVMTVHLHPEGLGNLLIRISNSGGNLKISMASEQKDTSDQLQSDSSQLLQALQQVMPAFSADDLSFSTQDQPSQDQMNNGAAGQNAAGGNANSGQWSEGQSYAEQSGRQVPGSNSYGDAAQIGKDVRTNVDTGNHRRSGSIYL